MMSRHSNLHYGTDHARNVLREWQRRPGPDEEPQMPVEVSTLFRERTTELPQLCLAKTTQKKCERWPSGARNCKTGWENIKIA